MDEWLTRARDALAATANLPASTLDLTTEDAATVLELAALAAHESGQRTNAPLLCYLLGKAEAAGPGLRKLASAVQEAG